MLQAQSATAACTHLSSSSWQRVCSLPREASRLDTTSLAV